MFQLLQKIFIHYTRLEGLSLSHGYIKSSSLSDVKSFNVSRLCLADVRFESLECLEQVLNQLAASKKGLHSLWLKNITIDSQPGPLRTTHGIVSVMHLSCDPIILEGFNLLHSIVQWLELTINSCFIQNIYASPLQVSSYKYPFLYNQEIINSLSSTPTIHILLEDKDNMKQLYMVPKHIVYVYFCLLLISRSMDGNNLVNISRKQARDFFFRIVNCFERDQIELSRVDTKGNVKRNNTGHKNMIYSPSLVLSLLSFNLIVSKLIRYLEKLSTSPSATAETHQITIELDMLKEEDIVILLPNFINLLKFLRVTPSIKDDDINTCRHRYSKKKLHKMQPGLIKLTFILPPTSRAIVLSYNKKKMSVVSVIETPLVLCLSYDVLTKNRFFEEFFDEVRDNHDCLNLHEYFTELHIAISRAYIDSSTSGSGSTSSTPTPQVGALKDLRLNRDRELCNTVAGIDDITSNIYIAEGFQTNCNKTKKRDKRNSSTTGIIFTNTSTLKNNTNPTEIENQEIDSITTDSLVGSSSTSFLQTDSSSDDKKGPYLPPRRNINKFIRHAEDSSDTCSEDCSSHDSIQMPRLFENSLLFRYIEDYVDCSNLFLVHNGCILSISYELLRKVYLLNLKGSLLHKHHILHKLAPKNAATAITSYVSYEDTYRTCRHTIKTMVKEYLADGYYAKSMDRLLIKGTVNMGTTSSNNILTEPPSKITISDISSVTRSVQKHRYKDENTDNQDSINQQLIPFIDATTNWESPLEMSLSDSSLSRENKFIRCVHNLLRSHASPTANSQLRAVAPVVYSKGHHCFYIHTAPGVIPNIQQLYGLKLLSDLHKNEFVKCSNGATSMSIISLCLSAYDLIYMLQGGLLSHIPLDVRKVNIETMTIVYSTKLEILLLLYLLIGQPSITILINKLNFKYMPTYRQDHINSILNDVLCSSLEWEPQTSGENPKETGKRRSPSSQSSARMINNRLSDSVVRRIHKSDHSEDSWVDNAAHFNNAKEDITDEEACNSYSLDCNTYTSSSDSKEDSTLNSFIVDSNEETDALNGAKTQPQDINCSKKSSFNSDDDDDNDDDPVVVGFSRKAQEFTSKKMDLVIYKDLIDDATSKTGITVNALKYTDLTMKIIKSLDNMKLRMRVRLCVLTSFINDSEELESTSAQAVAEHEYVSHVIFLIKMLKYIIKANIQSVILDNIALDWSPNLLNVRDNLISRVAGLRSSLTQEVGVFYIVGSTIQAEKP